MIIIEASSPNEVDIPALNLAPDTMYSYHGDVFINKSIIKIPGLPPNDYHRISIFGGQHDVHSISGEYVQLRTDLGRVGDFPCFFNSGYARDDGRNRINWQSKDIRIQDIQPFKIRFKDKFTIGRMYIIRTVNDILLEGGVWMPKGTSFNIGCNVNFQPTILENAYTEAGHVTLEFSQDLSQEGSIAGIDYDYIEFKDNELHIYTQESGEFRIQYANLFDIYENPIEDGDTDVSVPVSETYDEKYRSRYDYEDVVLSRGYEWLMKNGIK